MTGKKNGMQINGSGAPDIASNTVFQNKLIRSSKWYVTAVLIVSIFILFEYSVGIFFFSRPIPSLVPTNPLTALNFVFVAVAFFLFTSKQSSKLKLAAGTFLCIVVLIICLIKLVSLITDINFHIDSILFRKKLVDESRSFMPNQMASFTAVNFILLSTSLLLYNQGQKKRGISSSLNLLAWFTAMVFIIGYAYRVDEFHRVLSKIPMSITTASSFILISTGFLLANPQTGFMNRFTTGLAGSATANILVRVAVLTPFVIGFICMLGEWEHLYSSGLGTALLVTVTIGILLIFIYYTAGILNKKDALRQAAESELRVLNENLEKIVAHRTEELEKINKDLGSSEQRYRDLYENSLVAIFSSDLKSSKILTVNEVGVELFGYKSKTDFMLNYDPASHFVDINEREKNIIMLKEKGEIRNHVQKMKKLNGSVFWAKLFVKLNYDNNIAESVIVDISSQIEAKESLLLKVKELESVNKELESFNYISSHDLQEPLRKIKSFVSVLQAEEEKKLSQEGQYYLNRMTETANRMQMLIDDLLTYSRTKTVAHINEKIDLNKLVDEVIRDFNGAIQEKNAVIKFENLCVINVIQFQFRQLVSNLISNSLKFAHPQRRLEVTISSELKPGKELNTPKLIAWIEYCHITYKDNGIGFDSQYNERVFEIFERLHSQEKYQGTGIGLAICKRIVENHKGVITASGEINKGVQFDIYIPVTHFS